MPINGLVTMTPTSIASTGTGNSSSINANGSVTFSTCATLSLDGVFTSSYDNYMVGIRLNGGASDLNVSMRLRASGTDNSTGSSYTYQYLLASSTSLTATRPTTTQGLIGYATGTLGNGITVYLFGPQLAQATAYRSCNVYSSSGASMYDIAGTHNQTTSYDGLSIYPNSSTIGGLITVYGFNQ